jgi:RNA-splicing ligase RtcB
MYDLLASDICVANAELTNAISVSFQNELESDAGRVSVRQKLIKQLADELDEYNNLLNRVNDELASMADVTDVNPDKVKALNGVKSKTESAIATVTAELSKIAKE